MEKIEAVARQKNHIQSEVKIENLSTEENIKLFELTYPDLLNDLFPSVQVYRVGECSIATVYDHINGHGSRKKKRRTQ